MISGCIGGGQTPVCNEPYILVGSECCLDANHNRICDRDETTLSPATTVLTQTTVAPTTLPQEIVCNPPYIRYAGECCLDANENNICDSHEISQSSTTSTSTTTTEAPATTAAPTTTVAVETTVAPTTTLAPATTTTLAAGCGNGVCDAGEDSTCCTDCGCDAGYYCSDNICKIQFQFAPLDMVAVIPKLNFCGDDVCASTESQSSCCKDCGCPPGKYCSDNECVAGTPPLFQVVIKDFYLPLAETEISEGIGNFNPTIYGNKVVWHKFISGQPQIMLYDYSTKNIVQVTENTQAYHADIYGTRLVWEDGRRPVEGPDPYYLDVASNVGGFISPKDEYQLSPAIYGNYVVWTEPGKDGFEDIYLFNLANSKETRVTNDNRVQYPPEIWGDYIVWSELDWDDNPQRYNVKAYQISSGKTSTIYSTTSQEIETAVGFCQDKIAYITTRNDLGKSYVYVYDLNRKLTSQINAGAGVKLNPAIYGEKLVWQDKRNGNWDIYMYDVATSTEKQITSSTSNDENPDIYGDYIVYQRAGKIYSYRV